MKKRFSLLMVLFVLVGMSACSTAQENTKGNVLTIGVQALSGTFHPAYSASVYDFYVNDLIYDSLLSKDEEGNFIPNLAASLPTISEDYKDFTFTLKEDTYFSNGNKVTTEDVAFSFMMLADPQYDGRYGSIVNNLVGYEQYRNGENETFEGIEVIDDTRIAFHFIEGNRDNLHMLSNLGISCKAEYPSYQKGDLEEIKQKLTKPIGSGPYKLKQFSTEDGAALERNEKDKREGYEINNLVLKPVNEDTKFESLKKGNIDVLTDISDPTLIEKGSKSDELQFNEYEKAGLTWLTFNCASDITKEQPVRKALTLAFDRKEFVDHAFACDDCSDEVSLSYVPQIFQNPSSKLHDYVVGEKQVEGLEDSSYNIEEANKILDDSGWVMQKDGVRYKDGKPLQIKMLLANEFKYSDTLVSMLNQHWKQLLGVDLKIANIEFNSLIAKLMNDSAVNEYDAFVLSSVFSSSDLGSIYTLFHSSQIGNGKDNFARINNAEIDALLDKGKQTFDEKEMEDIYLQLSIAIEEQYSNIPMYGLKSYDFYTKSLKDFTTNAYYPWTKAMKDAKFS